MIARFLQIATAPDDDRMWFADHGRRKFRYRDSVIVRRDGLAVAVDAPGAGALDDALLAIIFSAWRQVAARSN